MQTFDIIILGAGPGGMEAARAAASSGKSVAIIEDRRAGGTCLNRGCIPTKCLNTSATSPDRDFTAAMQRMHGIVDTMSESVEQGLTASCTYINGRARFTAPRTIEVNGEQLTAPEVIIATGSQPTRLPIAGAELAITSDELLSLDSCPESVVIIGGGVIGLEFASILAAFGTKVTVLEYCKEVLPGFDAEIAKRLRTYLTRRGITITVSAAVTAINPDLSVTYETRRGPQTTEPASLVVMATGRKAVLPEGLDKAGVELTPRGFIATDDAMLTSAPGIYAIGDVNGRCMLAHAAEAQARMLFGAHPRLDIVPGAVFTVPEAAMVGLTQDNCPDCIVGKTGFGTNGKAMAMGETDGLVKLVCKSDGTIVGVHIVGPHASDMLAAATLMVGCGMNVDTLAEDIIFAHPTLPEALITAARAAKK